MELHSNSAYPNGAPEISNILLKSREIDIEELIKEMHNCFIKVLRDSPCRPKPTQIKCLIPKAYERMVSFLVRIKQQKQEPSAVFSQLHNMDISFTSPEHAAYIYYEDWSLHPEKILSYKILLM
jgi:hypothetical protein